MSRWLPSMRGLPRAYWFVWAGTLVNRLGGFVLPFLALYLTGRRRLSVDEVGLIVALYGAGTLASGPVGGALADRVGRRTTMVGAMALGAAAMLALGFARGTAAIAGATLALGFFGELYRPAVQAMVADLVAPADRQRAYGLLYWVINVGFSMAPVLGGLLASSHAGYTALFVGDAATSLAFAAIVRWRVPETLAPRAAQSTAAAPRPSLWAPYSDGVLLSFVALVFLVAIVFHQGSVALALDMRAHGIPPQLFGAIIALNGAVIVLLQPFATVFVQRFDRSHVLAAGGLLAGVGYGLPGLVPPSAPVYAVSIAIWTLGEMAVAPVAPAVIADLAPAELRGSYQGAYQLGWGGSTFVAPMLGAFVLGRFGSAVLWRGCLVAGVLVAIGHVVIAGPRRRRIAAIRAARTPAPP